MVQQHIPPDPTDDTLPDRAIKGRGAVSNRVSRYFKEERQRTTDGWELPEDEDLPPLRTTVMRDVICGSSRLVDGFTRSLCFRH